MEFIDRLTTEFSTGTVIVRVMVVLGITFFLSLASRLLIHRLSAQAGKTTTIWDNAVIDSIGPPLRVLIWVVGLSVVANMGLAAAESSLQEYSGLARKIGAIIVFTWFLLRLIKSMHAGFLSSKRERGEDIDQSVADAISKLLGLSVWVVAGLVVMQTLGFSMAGVLTFGGVGGIAVGFAARDMLANFFGGLMLYLDRPFSVGDWVRSPEREIEGVVEEIGWRVTVIRNFDSRPLYVPNAAFSSISIENVSRMTNRRIYETIGIRYSDATAINSIVQQVTDLLESHPEIDQEQTLMVSFTTFAPSSLDFFVYCYTKTRVGLEFFRTKQQIMLEILKIIENNGAECAFPTTTVHLQGEEPEADDAPGEKP
ncbi:MAG: mechanosensitive ion channel family protein [Gammaproteobacteria bacterium]|nr:mechanosensitive ion channel family protein [Gammaproteobacteria bacterium]